MTTVDAIAGPLLDALSLCDKARLRVLGRKGTKREVDRLRALFYSGVWQEAAQAVGASVRALDRSLLEIRCDDAVIRVHDNLTSLDDPVTLAVAGNKPLVHRLLAERGVPVPKHLVCRSRDLVAGWRFVASANGPCVVKPARGGAAGIGITTGIRRRHRLVRAMVHAGAYCSDVVIELQVEGDVYRLLYFDGDLLDAVLRRPPTVRGDGKATVRRLVEAENRDRIRKGIEASQSLIKIDWELRDTLRDGGHSLSSIPRKDDVVRLKNVVNDNRGDDNESAADYVCSAVVDDGARAAATVGTRLAGVDIITTDPRVPLGQSGGVIIEINATPGYYYHYMKRGARVPVATMILERWKASVVTPRRPNSQ